MTSNSINANDLEGNQINASLDRATNNSASTNDGHKNNVVGPKSGQCSAKGF